MAADIVILTNTSGPIWQRSIGAYQIAHHCRLNGFTVQVIDFIENFKKHELEKLLNGFIDSNTLAVGVSTTFFCNESTKKKYISTNRNIETVISEDIRDAILKLKTKYNSIKIFAGGAKSYRITNDELFDVVFHGYSEQPVVEYMQSIRSKLKRLYPRKKNLEIIERSSSYFDITSLQHQWHEHDFIMPQETLPIEISRGCIFKCKFCSYPLNGKKKFDYLRDPQHIKDELIKNYEQYGTVNYFFTDDTFNDSTYKLETLHKIITSLPFKIKFVTYLRLDLIYAHQEQIKLLYEMGLGSAFFGIESLNYKSAKSIGKGMSPNKIKNFLIELHDIHWKKEIPITCSFIVGLPFETTETIKNTRDWCQISPINDIWFPLFINPESFYKSEFDVSYADFGYKLDINGKWSNEFLDYDKALLLAEEFNNQSLYKEKYPSSWFLFSLLSYGYTIDELKNIKIKDLPWYSMARKKITMINLYKKKLFRLIN